MIIIRAFMQRSIRQAVESEILMTSAERIYEYGQLPQEEDFGGERGLIETSPDWPDRGAVEFRNYSFRYRSTRETALRELNLRIEPNEKIGIIGRTGIKLLNESIFYNSILMLDHRCREIISSKLSFDLLIDLLLQVTFL